MPRRPQAAHHRGTGRRDRAADRRVAGMERDERARLSAAYRRFAEDEARGKSPLYEELAHGVAGDHEILAFLLTLPRLKRQPNLLFSAARFLFGTPDGWSRFRRGIAQRKDGPHELVAVRRT